MIKKQLQMVLHAHIPYIRHPEHPWFLEELWLFEAISETYLPLLRMLNNLRDNTIKTPLTISFSPLLLEMLHDTFLMERYCAHVVRMIELGNREKERNKHDPAILPLITQYQQQYRINLEDIEKYKNDIIGQFAILHMDGCIDIIASAASYAYLPLYEQRQSIVDMQIMLGIEAFKRYFTCNPTGFWLPECGYYPGIESILEKYDIYYTYVSAHAVLLSPTSVKYGVFQPVHIGHSSVIAYPQDIIATNMIWNIDGIPSHKEYRDFHRDIGMELDHTYIDPNIAYEGIRIFTGYKYYAITNYHSDDKEYYNPEAARNRIITDVNAFITQQHKRLEMAYDLMQNDDMLLLTSMYSSELFGHHWYEGIDFLEQFFIMSNENDSDGIQVKSGIQVYDSLESIPLSTSDLIMSSWGNEGYSMVWIDDSNSWIYRHIYYVIDKMLELRAVFNMSHVSDLQKRVLNQAMREVLLIQTSDWALIMRSGISQYYAQERIEGHVENFNKLYTMLSTSDIDIVWLLRLERHSPLFSYIDYYMLSCDTSVVTPTWKNNKINNHG